MFSSECRKSSSSETLIGDRKVLWSKVLNGQGHVLPEMWTMYDVAVNGVRMTMRGKDDDDDDDGTMQR